MGDGAKHSPGPDIDALVRAFVRREALLDGADVEATLGDFAKVVADACQTERATLAAQLAEAERLLREWDEKPEMRDTDHDKWEEAWHERREAFLDRIDGDGEVGG
jgi:hypothetical protein